MYQISTGWDPEFAKGNFELGYYDRAEDRIIMVPLKEVAFPQESPRTFQLVDMDGEVHRIPFHRVREFIRTLNAFGIGGRRRHTRDMAVSQSYRDFVLEQLGRVTPVTGKAMFGGVGIYAQGLFFALIAEDRLYFKVDDATRPDFERLGMEPFRPYGEDSAMGYYEVPSDVVEEIAHLETWMRKAIDVATKAKRPRTKRSK